MPLSENEERILAEIERRLSEDDPRFVERARRATATDRQSRRARLSVGGFVLGFLLLLGLTFHIAFGYAGFALMLLSLVIGVRALTSGGPPEALGARLRRALSRRQDDRTS